MDQELVFGKSLCEIEVFFASGGVEDALCACFERGFELRNDL